MRTRNCLRRWGKILRFMISLLRVSHHRFMGTQILRRRLHAFCLAVAQKSCRMACDLEVISMCYFSVIPLWQSRNSWSLLTELLLYLCIQVEKDVRLLVWQHRWCEIPVAVISNLKVEQWCLQMEVSYALMSLTKWDLKIELQSMRQWNNRPFLSQKQV